MDAIVGADRIRERHWLERSVAGDTEAFSQLYSLHIRAVYWQALRALRTTADAEDAAQDVFVLAWSKRSDIRIVDQSILPWLLVTTRNVCLNRLKQAERNRRRTAASPDTTEVADPRRNTAHEVEGRLLLDAIEDAVSNLTETDQTLYYLCIDEGLSYKDAAQSLGTTHASVRNRLSRIRHTLRLTLSAQKEGLL